MIIKEDFIKKFNLSDREAEVAVLILDGLDNRKIAQKLFIMVATVKTHVYNLYNKAGVRNRYELISLIQSGFDGMERLKKPRRLNMVYFIPVGLGVLVFLALFTVQFFLGHPASQDIYRKKPRRDKLVAFSEANIPQNIQSIPKGLDPLTTARWFFHIGSVQKNRELWQKLLTKDDWSKAKMDSIWSLLAEKERSYYFVNIGEDEPERKKYFFQRQVDGNDFGNPGPIVVIREDGEWRVFSANP